MSWTERDLKEKCVRAIHKRVREVVGLYFVASDNVLGSTWFPFVDTIGLQPAARRGRTPDGAVTIATDLEALVIKAFVGEIERVDVGGGRTVDCVLFRNRIYAPRNATNSGHVEERLIFVIIFFFYVYVVFGFTI